MSFWCQVFEALWNLFVFVAIVLASIAAIYFTVGVYELIT